VHLGSPWGALKTLEFFSRHVYSIVTIKHETYDNTNGKQYHFWVIYSHDSHDEMPISDDWYPKNWVPQKSSGLSSWCKIVKSHFEV
jgi:hypothetical protein